MIFMGQKLVEWTLKALIFQNWAALVSKNGDYCDYFIVLGRFFGAMFNKLGVPIPTVIGPKVLAQARALCKGEEEGAHLLEPGVWVNDNVGNQEAKFFRIHMTEDLVCVDFKKNL